MRRESHRHRGVYRRSTATGWGHRAVYIGAAVTTASLIAGFALAGYYLGAFSHVFNSSSAIGNQNAPYGVQYLSEYATYAALISNINFTNGSGGPCFQGALNGTNQLNNSSTSVGTPFDLGLGNSSTNVGNNSVNSSTTIFCLNWVNNGQIFYNWNYVNGTAINATNYSAWDNITAPANNITGNATYNASLFNFTGNANLTNNWRNMTGCNPVFNNSTLANHSNCKFFAGNNETAFMPHGGFYNGTGVWINETTAASPDPWYWHPNQTGYLPNDLVYQASVEFLGTAASAGNMTYQIDVAFEYASPLPQIFYVNTGAGANETVTFVFDMSAAWTTAMTNMSAQTNASSGFFSGLIASIGQVSITVYQCYPNLGTGAMTCPGSLGGTTAP